MADTAVMTSPPLTRREFLFYIWSASLALTMAGSVGAVLWFAYPRFRVGEFGGIFSVPTSTLPAPGDGPVDRADGRFWMVSTQAGFLAIYKVCTHLGCLYKWVPSNNRFECPCHGSKFQADGTWIEGPAPRNLDRFIVQVLDANGNVLAETKAGDANADPDAGDPVPVPDDAVEIAINTGQRVKGALH